MNYNTIGVHMHFKPIYLFVISFLFLSCSTEKRPKEVVLYETYCASCHVAPNIHDLPKDIWKQTVLPAMAARMGIISDENHPYFNLSFPEQLAIIKTGIFPNKPIISNADWALLERYIIRLAPDSLVNKNPVYKSEPIRSFKTKPIALDSAKGSLYTYLKIDTASNSILTGTRKGELRAFDLSTKENRLVGYYNRAITDAKLIGDITYVTSMGILLPSEIPSGRIVLQSKNTSIAVIDSLHRPVHTLYSDLNDNGQEEILISEFGDLTGKLSLLKKDAYGFYKKELLLNVPGTLRTVAKDMDNDGKKDIVVMAAQGDEAVYILFQKEELNFSISKVIRFNPVYGSSWFELVDFNGDGFEDIITVHGDNADESYTAKPYHGMRIHINDGQNNFRETYFQPMNGATRVLANDFDADGDIDLALLATFPDYTSKNTVNFMYLENVDSKNFIFEREHLAVNNLGRWFLMDAADIDNDGDTDIVLSALTYSFTPVPEALEKEWSESYTDLLILENVLN